MYCTLIVKSSVKGNSARAKRRAFAVPKKEGKELLHDAFLGLDC